MREFVGFVGIFAFAAMAAGAQPATGAAAVAIPHLRNQGAAAQMMVDGKPFLMLAGELRNSTTSSLEFMRPVWPKLVALHLNTVLAAVPWELLEPKEGHFDFTLVDAQIHAAESYDLRLVFLWFASWKNGASSYPPIWVKGYVDRFPRARRRDGASTDTLSAFSPANLIADSRAFAALMRHIKQVDSRHRVIMIQVENEVGLLGDSRDRSDEANKAFAQPVPRDLLDYMAGHKDALYPEFRKAWEAAGARTSGAWEEVFGKAPYTDEIFMAWNYARYVGGVAAAGKAEYPVPMYVNTWCSMGDRPPGTYPSGGPLPHVADVWKVGAPAIDFRSPDLHATNFSEWVDWYHPTRDFPLFIPEAFHATGHYNIFYVMGQHDGIGLARLPSTSFFSLWSPALWMSWNAGSAPMWWTI
ncbi:MAG TPA: beta-galactosidase [Bryobacteraceae bacterium]|nr:beta-galactosidase [Bryobacteraceae bacterium]